MRTVIYPSVTTLENIADLLATITPDKYIAPDEQAPKGAHYVGKATDNQKALETLILLTNQKHVALHEAQGIPFGLNKNVDPDHRGLHITIDVLQEMLHEDVTQTFPELNGPYVIDRNWKVYWVDERFLARVRRIFSF